MIQVESCIIYCRKSNRNATTDDESFENQEDTCRAYAQSKGYSVYKVYREAHSGADLLHRPLIWEAMDDIRSGKAEVLVVRNFDRLARKTEHSAVIRYEVKEKAKGRVEAALDSNEPDSLTQKILDVVAEAERQNAVARMQRGKRRRVTRGALPGMSNPKFGYQWDVDKPGKRSAYIEDPETAPIVRRMFQLIKQGMSIRGVMDLFNVEHVPTPSQITAQNGHIGRHKLGGQWIAGSLHRMLTDRTYIGDFTAYKLMRTEIPTRKALRPAGSAELVQVAVPRIVDLDTFNTVQHLLSQSDQNGRRPIDPEPSWLRRHVYCGICGSKMAIVRASKDGRYLYRCLNRKGISQGGKECPAGAFSIRSHLLDQPVYEALAAAMVRRKEVEALMLERAGSSKQQAVAATAESYAVQVAEKRELLESAKQKALLTRDLELAQDFIRTAEKLNQEVHALELGYAEAREELDEWHAEKTWVGATLKALYENGQVPGVPSPEDIRAFPYKERRLLLAVTGLHIEVFPRHHETRVDVIPISVR